MDLRQIAEMLKKEMEGEEQIIQEDYIQLVGFVIGKEDFAVDIHAVKEIIEVPDITRVPKAPHYVLGVINLRGHIVPVIDLRKRFNLPYPFEGEEEERKIVVVESEDKVVGIMVDSVTQVLRIPSSRVEPPHGMISGIESDYIEGIGKREGGKVVVILNINKLLEE